MNFEYYYFCCLNNDFMLLRYFNINYVRLNKSEWFITGKKTWNILKFNYC